MNAINLSWGTISFTVGADSANIVGVAGPFFPRLLVPLKLHFYELKAHELTFQSISAQLCTMEGATIAEATAKPFVYTVRASFPAQHQLEFPIPHVALNRLETLRGTQPMFNLRLDIQVIVHVQRTEVGEQESFSQAGLHPVAGTIPLEISLSQWCEKIAPGLGIGIISIFELPAIPLSEIEDYKRAHDSLTRAHKKFMMGEYDDSVAECRKAIEPIRQHLQKKKMLDPSVLAADYADKVGQATAEWLMILLGKTHGVASIPHHSTKACFNRMDAQMILTITISLVAYILRSREQS